MTYGFIARLSFDEKSGLDSFEWSKPVTLKYIFFHSQITYRSALVHRPAVRDLWFSPLQLRHLKSMVQFNLAVVKPNEFKLEPVYMNQYLFMHP